MSGLELASRLADIIIATHNEGLSKDYYKVSQKSHDEWFGGKKAPYINDSGEKTKIGKDGKVVYYSTPKQKMAYKKKGKKITPMAAEMNDAMKQSNKMASLSEKQEITSKEASPSGYIVSVFFQREPAENKGFYSAKVDPFGVDMGEGNKYPSYTSGTYKQGKLGRLDSEIIKSIGKWASDNGIIAVVESTFNGDTGNENTD